MDRLLGEAFWAGAVVSTEASRADTLMTPATSTLCAV